MSGLNGSVVGVSSREGVLPVKVWRIDPGQSPAPNAS
jgi:hypothetical protein